VLSDAITVAPAVTFSESGSLGADDSIGSLVMQGTMRHEQGDADGLAFRVRGNATISGAMDVSARGLLGARQGGNATDQGQAYDAQGQVVAIVTGEAGGSHGGLGGSGVNGVVASAYDSLAAPSLFGAGGGTNAANLPAGNGGGRIDLQVDGTLALTGAVRANGQNIPDNNRGCGAGGSVRLRVGTLTGAGAIQAIGGDDSDDNGNESAGGGGGRIAVEYTTTTFTGPMLARGGWARVNGGAGTLFLKQAAASAGQLVIDNGGLAGPATSVVFATAYGPVTLRSGALDLLTTTPGAVLAVTGGTLNLQGAGATLDVSGGNANLFDASTASTLSIAGGALNLHGTGSPQSLVVTGGTVMSSGSLDLGPGVLSMTGGSFVNAGTMTLAVFDGTAVSGGRFVNTGRLDVLSNAIVVAPGVTLSESGTLGADDSIGSLDVRGRLTHEVGFNARLSFTVMGDATVAVDGAIDVSGVGLRGAQQPDNLANAGQTYAPGFSAVAAGATGSAGGSHGGLGGNNLGTLGQTYGSATEPGLHGSGGGTALAGDFGGNGGGRVDIDVVGTLSLNGVVRADGTAGETTTQTGGGSGGSVLLHADALVGGGNITADGGSGNAGGGGGRIAIEHSSGRFLGTLAANGGTGAFPGDAGSIERTAYCVDLDDGSPCTTDVCDATGAVHTPLPDDASCSDGDASNGEEMCILTCEPAPAGLIHWWPGDGHAEDIAGGRHAVLEAGASFGAGRVSQGFVFSGTSGERVRTPHDSRFDLEAMPASSFGGWARADTIGDEIVVAKRVCNVDAGWSFGTVQGCFVGNLHIGGSGLGVNIRDGNFHHFACVKENSEYREYIDGVLVGTSADHATTVAVTDVQLGALSLGACTAASAGQLHGAVDEIQLWNRALTLAEIQEAVLLGSGGYCKNAVPHCSACDAPTASEPVVAAVDDVHAPLGVAMSLQIDAIDADGDWLSYESIGTPLPPGLSLDPNTGLISGTPLPGSLDGLGETSGHVIRVTDGCTVTDSTEFSIRLSGVPLPPPFALFDFDDARLSGTTLASAYGGFTGTTAGSITTGEAGGIGQRFRFNGTGGQLSVGDATSALKTGGSMTVAMALDARAASAQTYYSCGLVSNDAAGSAYSFAYSVAADGRLATFHEDGGGDRGSTSAQTIGSGPSRVAFVRDATARTYRHYIEGKEDNGGAVGYATNANGFTNCVVRIGSNAGANNFANAYIDELAIWHQVLDADQLATIAWLYRKGISVETWVESAGGGG
jgi:hypothetical protein